MRRSALLAIATMALLLGACDTIFEPVDPSTPDSLASEAPGGVVTGEAGAVEPGDTDPDRGTATAVEAAGSGTSAVDERAEADTASAAPGVAASSAPLPFDMLSADEMDLAIALALDSEVAADALGAAVDRDAVAATDLDALADLAEQPSYRVVYVQRWPDKAAEGRAAEVLVFRYDTGEPYLAKVDLETGATEAVDVPTGFPVPISPAEIAEAAAVARSDDRVSDALAEAGLDPEAAQATALLTVGVESNARCSEHRCLRLFFASLRAPTPSFSVVFDTVDLEVVEVEPMPARREP